MFIDHVVLEVFAGKGGNGIVAWRREKYLPKGGPYGGDGGSGGAVIFEVDSQILSLEAYRHRTILKAENGKQGETNNRRGRRGKDLVLKIPQGTVVKDFETGEILYDFTKPQEKWVICKGGRGGKGNTHFKSPTNRAPNYATLGKLGESKKITLELKIIADIGLVGFPNAGKSTFISKVTDAVVKIAPYPFTTLYPNMGVIRGQDFKQTLVADIPGIITGAHQNKGLGFQFLRHIERTGFLLFILDASGLEQRDPLQDFENLRHELLMYNPQLLKKPYAAILNKMDIASSCISQEFQNRYPNVPVFKISALTGQGVEALIDFLGAMT